MKDNIPAQTKFTPEAQRAACRAYSETASRSAAAAAAGVSMRTVARYYANDPTFREAMVEAKAAFVRTLEAEAIKQAVGVTQQVPGPGGVFYDKTTYSPTVLIHLLKKLDPERHGDKPEVHVLQNESIGMAQLSPEARAQIQQILIDATKPKQELDVEIGPPMDVESENDQAVD